MKVLVLACVTVGCFVTIISTFLRYSWRDKGDAEKEFFWYKGTWYGISIMLFAIITDCLIG